MFHLPQQHPHQIGRSPALWLVVALLAAASPALAQNDHFIERSFLSQAAETAFADNTTATFEPGEPDHAPGHPASASVWWEWTAPENGYYELNTDGSTFDTILAVYTLDFWGEFVRLTSNVDTYTLDQQSRCIFEAGDGGETFYFVVDGEAGATGDVTLNIHPAVLRNDEFGQRIPLAGQQVLDVQSNVGASVSRFEPNHIPSLNSSSSVWWEWACDSDGWVTVDTLGSSFDTIVAVYIRNVILIGNNDNYYRDEDDQKARMRFFATAGNRYQIVVDGSDGLDEGAVHLSVDQSLDHPPNDNVSSPHILVSEVDGDTYSAYHSGASMGASVELGEPDHNPIDQTTASASVWFEWTSPPLDRLVTIDTFNSNYDTILAVYSRKSDNLIRWAANDDHEDADDLQSQVTFHSKAGVTYLIAVDGYQGEQGDFGVNLLATSQQNDDFDGAVQQFGLGWQSTSNNSDASAEIDEPAHSPGNPASHSIWWSWESTINGEVRIDTLGSDFDTLIAAYEGYFGDGLGSLTQLATNDDAPGASNGQSSLTLTVEYGTTYFFAVDGKNASTGNILLTFATLGGYDQWVSQFPSLQALLSLPQDDPARVGALPDGDPDYDGFPNRLEAVFGLNPEINSQPSSNDPNKDNAPTYSFDGTNVIIEFTLDPRYAEANSNDDSLRFSVGVERSSNGIVWNSLTSQPIGGNRHRAIYPVPLDSNDPKLDLGLFRVTARDSQIVN